MKVYVSDVKDWSAEVGASGKRVKPSHPYDLEPEQDELSRLLFYIFFRLILQFFLELFL